eukprot:scaffold133482_cov23-Tisochrysis_lutea.AAC.2
MLSGDELAVIPFRNGKDAHTVSFSSLHRRSDSKGREKCKAFSKCSIEYFLKLLLAFHSLQLFILGALSL